MDTPTEYVYFSHTYLMRGEAEYMYFYTNLPRQRRMSPTPLFVVRFLFI